MNSDPGDQSFATLLARQPLNVSRETYQRLSDYVESLKTWQKRINLISPRSLPHIWDRHILDSLQLLALRPEARFWVDLGSGAGLPGLVIACVLADLKEEACVHLIESNGKKAAFLRSVVQALNLPARVHAVRIEIALPTLSEVEVVTARALAPLVDLIRLSNLLLKSGATGLFPKGREVEGELTAARAEWHFYCDIHPSVTDADGRIVAVTLPPPEP